MFDPPNTKHASCFYLVVRVGMVSGKHQEYFAEARNREVQTGHFKRSDVDPKLNPSSDSARDGRALVGQLAGLPKLSEHRILPAGAQAGIYSRRNRH
jgi:hypothetical protein